MRLDLELTPDQVRRMEGIHAPAWFTPFEFRNARSPIHPHARALDTNHEMKRRLVMPWIERAVRGRRVLDLFCANGAFSIEAARAGAAEVVGLDRSPERIECATFLAEVLAGRLEARVSFQVGDVYRLGETLKEPFDVVLALGGLYHVADVPHVLLAIRELARERLVVQTSQLLPGPFNLARFVRRPDLTAEGLPSFVGGQGAWRLSVPCFEAILAHAGFRVLERRRPPLWKRLRYPWYAALAEPL